jgi:hypothetical protein
MGIKLKIDIRVERRYKLEFYDMIQKFSRKKRFSLSMLKKIAIFGAILERKVLHSKKTVVKT